MLCCAMLCCAILCCAVLCCALMCSAVLCCVVLCSVVLMCYSMLNRGAGYDLLCGQVRAFTACAMSFYHGKRDLAASLSRRVKTLPAFLALEQQVAPSLPALQEAFPDMGE
jgi:hypothetical protein